MVRIFDQPVALHLYLNCVTLVFVATTTMNAEQDGKKKERVMKKKSLHCLFSLAYTVAFIMKSSSFIYSLSVSVSLATVINQQLKGLNLNKQQAFNSEYSCIMIPW